MGGWCAPPPPQECDHFIIFDPALHELVGGLGEDTLTTREQRPIRPVPWMAVGWGHGWGHDLVTVETKG